MAKLTEQWKDMDLADEHLYYWRMPNGEVRIMNKISVCSYKLCYDGGKIDILAPVPSYDEYKRLQEQLKDAEYILDEMGWADRGLIDDYFEKWGVK